MRSEKGEGVSIWKSNAGADTAANIPSTVNTPYITCPKNDRRSRRQRRPPHQIAREPVAIDSDITPTLPILFAQVIGHYSVALERNIYKKTNLGFYHEVDVHYQISKY